MLQGRWGWVATSEVQGSGNCAELYICFDGGVRDDNTVFKTERSVQSMASVVDCVSLIIFLRNILVT